MTRSSSVNRGLLVGGAALLLISFFLTWLTVKPGEEFARLSQSLESPFGPALSEMAREMTREFTQNLAPVKFAGGDLKNGLGWIILGLGLAAAALPFLAEMLEPAMQRKLIVILLSIGGILFIYIISTAYRYLSIGFFLAIAGYALEFAGAVLRGEVPWDPSDIGAN